MVKPWISFLLGAACVVAAVWLSAGRVAGCVVLGAVGLVLLLVSAAALAPDREGGRR